MSASPLSPIYGEPSNFDRRGFETAAHDPRPVNLSAVVSAADEHGGVDPASEEIHSIALAIEELQERLRQANSQLGHAAVVRTTEVEIGRLFVEAQRFSEDSLARLEQQVQEILVEAESKATQILREATEEAQDIRRQAQNEALVSSRTAQDLQLAIAGFTSVNSELVKELSVLNEMLTPSSQWKPPPTDRSHNAIGNM
jgi:dsDNA-specific endonuclease/ATPase MutS2